MIVVASPAPSSTWEKIAGVDQNATFFQTPAWARVVTRMGGGFSDRSVLVRLDDGAQAVVPRMCRTAGRVFLAVESAPIGLYGPPVSERGLSPGELLGLAAHYRPRRSAGAVVTETPGRGLDFGTSREVMNTLVLRWPLGTEPATIVQGYRKGHRTGIRKAEREGVQVSLAGTMGEFLDYHALYLETLRRWTRAPALVYPPDVFRELCESSKCDSRIRLWLARGDGRLLAGALVFHHGQGAAYWHGASTEEGRQRNAGNLAVHAAIMDSLETGKTMFDFLPSAGLTDVEHFKTGFGAEPVEVGTHRFEASRLYRLLSAARARMRASRGGSDARD